MILISKATLDFLSDLKRNNYKEWFQMNRARYEEAKTNYLAFIQEIIDEISKFDPLLKGLEAKSCTYRINRDIRFSNDKTPYKTHMGAFIVPGGKNNGDRLAGYYLHIEPGGNSMIAGGAYMPPAPWLSAIRVNIDDNGERLMKIIREKEFIRYFGGIEGEKLKSAPKGYPRDHPYIELLKLKSFLASRIIPDKDITSDKLSGMVITGCRIMKPLNDFLNVY